jgi:hypothetical protein
MNINYEGIIYGSLKGIHTKYQKYLTVFVSFYIYFPQIV